MTKEFPKATYVFSSTKSSTYYLYRFVVCLLSKAFRSNFICEHKWKFKFLIDPSALHPECPGMLISPSISDLYLMFLKHLHFFCISRSCYSGTNHWEEIVSLYSQCYVAPLDVFGSQWKLHSYLGWLWYSTWST